MYVYACICMCMCMCVCACAPPPYTPSLPVSCSSGTPLTTVDRATHTGTQVRTRATPELSQLLPVLVQPLHARVAASAFAVARAVPSGSLARVSRRLVVCRAARCPRGLGDALLSVNWSPTVPALSVMAVIRRVPVLTSLSAPASPSSGDVCV